MWLWGLFLPAASLLATGWLDTLVSADHAREGWFGSGFSFWGERNSAHMYARRGIDGGNAVALVDGVIYLPTTPRRAIAEVMSPRRAITV